MREHLEIFRNLLKPNTLDVEGGVVDPGRMPASLSGDRG